VELRHVYVLEAHAADGWALKEDNEDEGVCVKQPKTLEQRVAAARLWVGSTDGAIPANRVLVDDMDNSVELAFEARPEKIVVVDGAADGGPTVLFNTGIGPYQYSVTRLEKFLEGGAAA
jgi:hypothetical protein